MKIAMIAPPFYALPTSGYGGIERAVYRLAAGLARAGHSVLLFAPRGTTVPGVTVVSIIDPMGPADGPIDYLLENRSHSALAHAWLREHQQDVDVIHDHAEGGAVFAALTIAPVVVTYHNGVGVGAPYCASCASSGSCCN